MGWRENESDGKRAENHTVQVLQHLKETNRIIDWRHATVEEDEYFGFDFVAITDDGQCFIDTKSRRLEFNGMTTSQRIIIKTRKCKDRRKRLILYYKAKLNEPIEKESFLLINGITIHQKKLREILLSKQAVL